jgi:UDP-N-acetylmuramoylalanine--D-glutamate ligase
MSGYRKFFKGKKVTVMGLGLLGRGVGDAVFLAEAGAKLTITDLKPSTMLRPSLKKLRKYNKPAKGRAGIKYVLGKHKLEDFRNEDMILKAAGVPLDSIYIKEAKKHKIPIEMDVSLFAKLAPEVTVVGVTGTRGKSMTTALIYEILSSFAKATAGQGKPINKFWANKPSVFLGGNVRGVATLPLL